MFSSFSGVLSSWTISQSQPVTTKKRENWHKQGGRKRWRAGKEEPTPDPTCQHQEGQVQRCLNKSRDVLLDTLLKPKLSRASIKPTLKD